MKNATGAPPVRTLTVGLLGAAALAAGLILVRQPRDVDPERPRDVPAGETQPGTISLDRIRALGY
ncbi:MAG TPA: hypothetical protein VK849_00430 [Longimicrobiales bacterium]|nr:hypothetical protein [Longimicrobiales bacterium]